MTKKKIIGLVVLGLVLGAVISGVVVWVLVGLWPKWYEPRQLSREDLLAAEERMVGTVADFKNASQVAEPFILELTGEQINDMLAVLIDRHRILPDWGHGYLEGPNFGGFGADQALHRSFWATTHRAGSAHGRGSGTAG